MGLFALFVAALLGFTGRRDTLHHVDELIVKGRLQDGQPFALMPDGPETPHPIESNQTIKKIDRIVIGSHEILFVDLCAWLREMANMAAKISKFDPNTAARQQAAVQIARS